MTTPLLKVLFEAGLPFRKALAAEEAILRGDQSVLPFLIDLAEGRITESKAVRIEDHPPPTPDDLRELKGRKWWRAIHMAEELSVYQSDDGFLLKVVLIHPCVISKYFRGKPE